MVSSRLAKIVREIQSHYIELLHRSKSENPFDCYEEMLVHWQPMIWTRYTYRKDEKLGRLRGKEAATEEEELAIEAQQLEEADDMDESALALKIEEGLAIELEGVEDEDEGEEEAAEEEEEVAVEAEEEVVEEEEDEEIVSPAPGRKVRKLI